MANPKRLSKVARDLNVGISTLLDFLEKHHKITLDSNPNTKVDFEVCQLLEAEFIKDKSIKQKSEKPAKEKSQPERNSPHARNEHENHNADKRNVGKSETVDFPARKNTGLVVKDQLAITKEKGQYVVSKPEVVEKPEVVQSKPELEMPQAPAPEPATPQAKPEPKPELAKPMPEPQAKADAQKAKEEAPLGKQVEKEPERRPTPPEKTEPVREVAEPAATRAVEKKQPDAVRTDRQKPKEEPPIAQKEENQNSPLVQNESSEEIFKTNVKKLSGPTIVGMIDLPVKRDKKKTVADPKKAAAPGAPGTSKRKKRKRINKPLPAGVEAKDANANANANPSANNNPNPNRDPNRERRGPAPGRPPGSGPNPQNRDRRGPAAPGTGSGPTGGPSSANANNKKKPNPVKKVEVNEEDVQKQIKETLARLSHSNSSKAGSKIRKKVKREQEDKRRLIEAEISEKESRTIKVTEFVSVSELASMMGVDATKLISICMSLGLFVSINQRLDAETISLLAEEFNYEVDFVSVELQEAIAEVEDKPEDLSPRSPIVTVMGHVDHGKTSLLDHIRKANVIAGEAGGITQHIGAYSVKLDSGQTITFLDTPGHQAFTAMRARGAQVTDVAIIVVSADDSVMPQTIEAINHAQAAGVPIIFAINKIDKPGANPTKIKEELANMNLLVEEWGGKYQSQDISAKKGININELLEKVLLEAEMLDLKANPIRKATGTVIEASLDKGRGYSTTVLVQNGTLRIGDVFLAGSHAGRVKAMFDERDKPLKEAGPSRPVLVLGLNGAPQAGDSFNVMESEREARDLANKREQLQREQTLRTQKHITLDEIGRRIAIGNFQELNLIVKGDVDGSIEALADSLIKLSTREIQVNIIHKAVGQISEADIMLATASNAIIVGFQVRPSLGARKLADKEGIDIRLYSIIYDAISEIKDAMEGMLSPEIKEEISGTAEIIQVFRISKVGTVAGCIVRDGKIARGTRVRVIRDGIVVYDGNLGSLKRHKDDAKEVATGFECGLNIDRFNDIKLGDFIEAYKQVEVKRTLS